VVAAVEDVPETRHGEAGGDDGYPMDCDELVHSLYHYLDGELNDERRRQIQEHLDLCGPCADVAEFEAELRVVIAERCRDRVPESLVERVAAAIDEERRSHHGGA